MKSFLDNNSILQLAHILHRGSATSRRHSRGDVVCGTLERGRVWRWSVFACSRAAGKTSGWLEAEAAKPRTQIRRRVKHHHALLPGKREDGRHNLIDSMMSASLLLLMIWIRSVSQWGPSETWPLSFWSYPSSHSSPFLGDSQL